MSEQINSSSFWSPHNYGLEVYLSHHKLRLLPATVHISPPAGQLWLFCRRRWTPCMLRLEGVRGAGARWRALGYFTSLHFTSLYRAWTLSVYLRTYMMTDSHLPTRITQRLGCLSGRVGAVHTAYRVSKCRRILGWPGQATLMSSASTTTTTTRPQGVLGVLGSRIGAV